MRTIIFISTQTSGTGSMLRIYRNILGKKFTFINVHEKFKDPKLISSFIPPKDDHFVYYNEPHLLAKPTFSLPEYKYVLNIRDPRDRISNAFSWQHQHPFPYLSTSTSTFLIKIERKISSLLGRNLFVLTRPAVMRSKDRDAYFEIFKKIVDNVPKDSVLLNTYALLCKNFDKFISNFCTFVEIKTNENHADILKAERPENLSKNSLWIGNKYSGADISPGRFKQELYPFTIKIINKKFRGELDFLAKHDDPSVKETYSYE